MARGEGGYGCFKPEKKRKRERSSSHRRKRDHGEKKKNFIGEGDPTIARGNGKRSRPMNSASKRRGKIAGEGGKGHDKRCKKTEKK